MILKYDDSSDDESLSASPSKPTTTPSIRIGDDITPMVMTISDIIINNGLEDQASSLEISQNKLKKMIYQEDRFGFNQNELSYSTDNFIKNNLNLIAENFNTENIDFEPNFNENGNCVLAKCFGPGKENFPFEVGCQAGSTGELDKMIVIDQSTELDTNIDEATQKNEWDKVSLYSGISKIKISPVRFNGTQRRSANNLDAKDEGYKAYSTCLNENMQFTSNNNDYIIKSCKTNDQIPNRHLTNRNPSNRYNSYNSPTFSTNFHYREGNSQSGPNCWEEISDKKFPIIELNSKIDNQNQRISNPIKLFGVKEATESLEMNDKFQYNKESLNILDKIKNRQFQELSEEVIGLNCDIIAKDEIGRRFLQQIIEENPSVLKFMVNTVSISFHNFRSSKIFQIFQSTNLLTFSFKKLFSLLQTISFRSSYMP